MTVPVIVLGCTAKAPAGKTSTQRRAPIRTLERRLINEPGQRDTADRGESVDEPRTLTLISLSIGTTATTVSGLGPSYEIRCDLAPSARHVVPQCDARAMRCVLNIAVNPGAVPAPSAEAEAFHSSLPGYRPTPMRELPVIAQELGVGAVGLKDESNRLGLPAFKVLGASWAIERALREQSTLRTLVAASAGNHGRAVAHVAASRGMRCRVFLPGRSTPSRRDAIAAEGAEVVIVDGDYELAVAQAADAAAAHATALIADVGESGPPSWVIDGYATLFSEAASQAEYDLIVVPVGVGSLAAAAARSAARTGAKVIAVEPVTAACLTASLAVGRQVSVPTPGTAMAGLDCAAVSVAAWPSLRAGIHGTITVSDDEAGDAARYLAAEGLAIGECGAAPLAALRALSTDPACMALRESVAFGPRTRVLLIATEGPTDQASYRWAIRQRPTGPTAESG